jgi:radical SAM superfamily enzyme YgiQ (UPF0313 family)
VTYDVILLTSSPMLSGFTRSYGPYRLASELRNKGYSVLVINHIDMMDTGKFTEILSLAIGDNTLCVGFSVSWFISATGRGDYHEYDMYYSDGDLWSLKSDNVYDIIENSVMYKFSQGKTDDIIDIVKNIKKDVKVVIGGNLAYDYIPKSKKADNIFIGFSENQFPEYIDSISKKSTKTFDRIVDYDTLGVVGEFNFRNSVVEYDVSDYIQPEEVLLIEFTRGCIFNCSFCNFPHRAQKTKDFIRYKESIRTELMLNYTKWGITRYVIVDDTFNDHTEKLILINEVIKDLPFKPSFWAYCRLDILEAHPEQAQLLKDIGVKEILYGLETWNERTAKLVKKGSSNEKKIKGMKLAKEVWGNEVSITISMVIGLPEDTKQSWYDFIDFLKTEGYKYIDEISTGPLAIRKEDINNQYRIKLNHLSEIEKNYKKYGYSFPYDDRHDWTRSDSGDINSLSDALMLTDIMYENFEEINSKFISQFDKAAHFDAIMEKLEIENDDFTQESVWKIIYKWCHKYYYTFLIEHLKKNND